jgi:hypothetical protein
VTTTTPVCTLLIATSRRLAQQRQYTSTALECVDAMVESSIHLATNVCCDLLQCSDADVVAPQQVIEQTLDLGRSRGAGRHEGTEW